MLLNKYRFIIMAVLFGFAGFLSAQTAIQFANTQKVVQGFDLAIKSLKKNSELPVIFPTKIPFTPEHQHYYIFVENRPHASGYIISIDTTPDCKGAHYCNIGSLTASPEENPQIYYDMQNRELTIPVNLKEGKKAYFTPSHPMGSYWPAQIEWRNGNVLYRLSWNIQSGIFEKETLITMVNKLDFH